MKKPFLIIFLISCTYNIVSAKTYFLSPTGNDQNTGTLNSPFWSFQKVQSLVSAGDTVYLRGGTYIMKPSDVTKIDSAYDSRISGYRYWTYVNYMTKSGTSGKRINYWAYPGEKPILDFTAIKPVNHRVIGFWVTASWLYFKGLDVIGVQVNCKINSQSECFHNEGSNNIFEQLNMHDGMAIGFYLTKGSNNLVLNCDAYNNYDFYSGDMKGGNTDGFGFHPGKGGTGNIARSCRAWFNSDDGYDCISSAEAIVFDHCWAFYNGYTSSFAEKGDGNGFKIGGHGANPAPSSLPNPMPSHTSKFCLSYYNKRYGFTANHHVEAPNYFYNNTSWDNKLANYCMLSKKIVKNKAGVDSAAVDCPGFSQVMSNNLSYNATRGIDTAFIGTCVLDYNSFARQYGYNVTAADFESVDVSQLMAPRNADGNLPNISLMHLKPTSNHIDRGVNVGLPFFGSAPDLGAFEMNPSTAIDEVGMTEKDIRILYKRSERSIIANFNNTNNRISAIRVYDSFGRTLYSESNNSSKTEFTIPLQLHGVYIITVFTQDGIISKKIAL
ncbi:MAG: T9SS type A sorting domain-containing protein [Paludibacter sp.]